MNAKEITNVNIVKNPSLILHFSVLISKRFMTVINVIFVENLFSMVETLIVICQEFMMGRDGAPDLFSR